MAASSNSSIIFDDKKRWGGILENPYLTRAQRFCLDNGRVMNLKRVLKSYALDSLLDVCCGTGEYVSIQKKGYVGIDNSVSFLSFAKQKNQHCRFVLGDAMTLPFLDGAFDASLLACASHHLADADFLFVLKEMKRVSRKFIFVDDSLRTNNQNPISKFFYGLDRGKSFRTPEDMARILTLLDNTDLKEKIFYKTFPAIHLHGVFVLEVVH